MERPTRARRVIAGAALGAAIRITGAGDDARTMRANERFAMRVRYPVRMSTQQESFDRAVGLLEGARAHLVAAGRSDLAVDAPQPAPANDTSAAVSGDVDVSSWEWLRGQFRGLVDRLRGTWDWCQSDQGREVAKRAFGMVRDGAKEAATTVTGAMRGDFRSIAKVADAALKALNVAIPGFTGWLLLAGLILFVSRGRE